MKQTNTKRTKKKLSEMSLEELWQLFPIFLTPHQECWKDWYQEEEKILKRIVTQTERISHIGSTYIDGIWAKPIIDILLEVPHTCDLSEIKKLLEQGGYICMNHDSKRMSFNKGYTEEGFAKKVFHIHLRYMGDCDELYFRDYLMGYPEIAKEYEKMKLNLWKEYEHDRDSYTNAKTDFIGKYTKKAKLLFTDRY